MAKKSKSKSGSVPFDLDDLSIDQHSLDRELIEQSVKFGAASRSFAMSKSELDQAKEALSRKDAELNVAYRDEHENAGEKATEAKLNTEVQTDSEHIEASDKYLAALAEYNHTSATKDAWHQRAYMLRELCGLFVAEYWDKSSVKGSSVAKVSDDAHMDRRRKMNEKRRTKI